MGQQTSLAEPSFYLPVDETGREALYRQYLGFLGDRNGQMDFEARRYSKRDESLSAMAASPVRYRGAFDEALFQYTNYRSSEETPDAMKLLLILCKMNAGEAFGVEVMRVARKSYFERPEPQYQAEKVVATEEDYHTKILVGATQYFGISDLKSAFTPPFAVKALIYSLANVPPALFHSILLAAELSGIYILCSLLEITRVVLRDQPEMRDAVEERLIAVLTDEIGHTSYNRLATGSLGLNSAKKLFPMVCQSVEQPELKALRAQIKNPIPFGEFDYRHLPEAATKQAFFV